MSSIISLKERQAEATRQLIVETSVELLESAGVGELTVRSVAKRAGMSERTIFRYFTTRDIFLDAVAKAALESFHRPPPPSTIKELLDFPARLYRCFEDRSPIVIAILHTDIYDRVRKWSTSDRWDATKRLIDEHAPHRTARERKAASTNVNYYLSASTWHYFRYNFKLSAKETVVCASSAARVIVEDICSDR